MIRIKFVLHSKLSKYTSSLLKQFNISTFKIKWRGNFNVLLTKKGTCFMILIPSLNHGDVPWRNLMKKHFVTWIELPLKVEVNHKWFTAMIHDFAFANIRKPDRWSEQQIVHSYDPKFCVWRHSKAWPFGCRLLILETLSRSSITGN